jgi:hypothetical protein
MERYPKYNSDSSLRSRPKSYHRVRCINTEEQNRYPSIRNAPIHRDPRSSFFKNRDLLHLIAQFVGTKSFNHVTTDTRFASKRMNEDIHLGSTNTEKYIENISNANLARYVISEYDNMPQEHFAELCQHVRTLAINFRTGNGKHRSITPEDVIKFTKKIKHAIDLLGRAVHLESLDLDFHNDGRGGEWQWIPRVAVGSQALEALSKPGFNVLHTLVLNLRANNVGFEVAKILGGLNNLQTLSIDLSNNNIDINAVKELAKLNTSIKLQSLSINLSKNKIDTNTALQLVELKRSTTLRSLSLGLDRNPDIGNEGISALADLDQAPALTTLCLRLSTDELKLGSLLDMCDKLKISRKLKVLGLNFVHGSAGWSKDVFKPLLVGYTPEGPVYNHQLVVALISLKDAPALHTLRLKISHTLHSGGKALLLMELGRVNKETMKKSNGVTMAFKLSVI